MSNIISGAVVTPEGLAIETINADLRSYCIDLVEERPRSAIYGWEPRDGWTFDLLERYTRVLDGIRAIEEEGFVLAWERPLSEVRE